MFCQRPFSTSTKVRRKFDQTSGRSFDWLSTALRHLHQSFLNQQFQICKKYTWYFPSVILKSFKNRRSQAPLPSQGFEKFTFELNLLLYSRFFIGTPGHISVLVSNLPALTPPHGQLQANYKTTTDKFDLSQTCLQCVVASQSVLKLSVNEWESSAQWKTKQTIWTAKALSQIQGFKATLKETSV